MRVLCPRNFDRRAKRAGLDQDDLAELIRMLIERPQLGPVIPGTGGARKVRIRLPGRGKSGGARVIYAVVLRGTALALLDVYTKSDQANLTLQECKTIAKLIRSGIGAMKAKKKVRKTSEVGQSIIKSLKEIRAWQRGDRKLAIQEASAPIPPMRIKAIRRKAAPSVRVFSELFGLPTKTIEQWEQGARRPDAASSLLLEVIDSNPEIVAAAAKRRKRAA